MRLGLGVSPAAEKFRCFFVCLLAVAPFNGRVRDDNFAVKAFEYGNAFDTVGQGQVVVVQSRSTLPLHS